MTDRARPGLVALYDIRPRNGAGPFLQPRSPYATIETVQHRGTTAFNTAEIKQQQQCRPFARNYSV